MEGLPAFHGGPVGNRCTLVSPLRADGGCARAASLQRQVDVARSWHSQSRQAREVAPSWWCSQARSAVASSRRRTLSFAFSPEPKFVLSEPLRTGVWLSWMHRLGFHVCLRRGSRIPFVAARSPRLSRCGWRRHPAERDVLGDVCRAPVSTFTTSKTLIRNPEPQTPS